MNRREYISVDICNSLNTIVLSKFLMGGGYNYLISSNLGESASSEACLFSKKHSVCINDAVKAIAHVVLSSSVCAFLVIGSLLAVLASVCSPLRYFFKFLLDKSSNIVEKLSMLLASLFMFLQHVDFSFLTHFLSKDFTVAFGGSLPLSLDFSGGVVCMPPLGCHDKR